MNDRDHSHVERSPTGGLSGLYSTPLPPDPIVLAESLRLIENQKSRPEDVANIICQDPVLALEVLRAANNISRTRNGTETVTMVDAVYRLGAEQVARLCHELGARETIAIAEYREIFDKFRSRGKRVGLVTRMIAATLVRSQAGEAQLAGAFVCFGEMIALLSIGQGVVQAIRESQSRAGYLYKLSHEHNVDVEKTTATFLIINGIPESILVAHDKELLSRRRDRAIIRTMVNAAVEMVDLFDANRWEKIAPGKDFQANSSLRLLQFTDPTQYRKLYERASEYLFTARTHEAKQRSLTSQVTGRTVIDQAKSIQLAPNFLPAPTSTTSLVELNTPLTATPLQPPGLRQDFARDRQALEAKFNLSRSRRPRRATRSHYLGPTPITLPQIKISKAQRTVSSMIDAIRDATTSEDLLKLILDLLVDKGPFEKTALIVVSNDRKDAIVVASRGPIPGNGKSFPIDDPLSPLALSLSRVQSFGSQESDVSPFGSRSFAIAPVLADHDTPVALYADCGNEGTITFEARRIFRTVVDLANQRLKDLDGGIPIELSLE